MLGSTVNALMLMITPPGVLIAMKPVRVSAAIVAVIVFDDATCEGDRRSAKKDIPAPKKFVPLIVI